MIIHIESCKKLSAENFHELIQFFLPNIYFQVTVITSNDGRTTKRFEYDYALKCQTLQWKCQIALDNT